MTENYNGVAGVEVAEWDADADNTEPVEQRHCRLEEMYYEECNGELIIAFEDRETKRFFDVSVPIKATGDWNDFADSLPRWSDSNK